MADTDVIVQIVVSWVLVPLFLTFIAWNLFQDHIELFRKRLYAYMLNRSIKSLNKKIGTRKQRLFADLSDFLREKESGGIVLEIGAGGGANFQYYPLGCTVTCLEPNQYFKGYLEKSAESHPHFIYNGLIVGDARNMQEHVEHESVDAVVCTLVLCSIPEVDKVMKEIVRILKPNGRFYFVEHVAASPKTWTRWWEDKFSPFWKKVSDGCVLNKETGDIIKKSGFSDVNFDIVPKMVGWRCFSVDVIFGHASK